MTARLSRPTQRLAPARPTAPRGAHIHLAARPSDQKALARVSTRQVARPAARPPGGRARPPRLARQSAARLNLPGPACASGLHPARRLWRVPAPTRSEGRGSGPTGSGVGAPARPPVFLPARLTKTRSPACPPGRRARAARPPGGRARPPRSAESRLNLPGPGQPPGRPRPGAPPCPSSVAGPRPAPP